jgi:hypothetical protein
MMCPGVLYLVFPSMLLIYVEWIKLTSPYNINPNNSLNKKLQVGDRLMERINCVHEYHYMPAYRTYRQK